MSGSWPTAVASWRGVVFGTALRGERWRRWSTVAAGVAVLLALPAVAGRLPAAESQLDAGTLRERILASAGQPYSGYAESTGQLGLPELSQLDQVAALLSGTTRIRAWFAAPDRWRVDDLTPAGERGTYHLGGEES